MIVGCYSLDLYCEGMVFRRDDDAKPWQPVQCHSSISLGGASQTERDAIREARSHGWYVRRAGAKAQLVLCAECDKYRKTADGKRGKLRVQLHGVGIQSPPTEEELVKAQRCWASP